jgi:hypothetical protein
VASAVEGHSHPSCCEEPADNDFSRVLLDSLSVRMQKKSRVSFPPSSATTTAKASRIFLYHRRPLENKTGAKIAQVQHILSRTVLALRFSGKAAVS